MRYVLIRVAAAMTVILTLATGAESDEISEIKERLAIVEERLDRLEAYRVADKDVCTDEYEQAVAFATSDVNAAAVPDLWDGTPFVVDISSTFPNADELLDVVEDEAERIRGFLGYEIFVAGDVLPLPDIQKSALRAPSRHNLIPPAQHIEIRCCYGGGISSAGTAFPWLRMILLGNDNPQSRHIIIHELYHLLGFTHPGESPGVVMSDSLMYGPRTYFGAPTSTRPSPLDLARLSCIYSATHGSYDQLTTPIFGANEAPCEKNGTGEITLYATAEIDGHLLGGDPEGALPVYIDGLLVGSLLWGVAPPSHGGFVYCGARGDGTAEGVWITETVKAGIHTVGATASDGTTWEEEVDVEVCGCVKASFD